MGLHQFLQDVGCEFQEILWRDVPRQASGQERGLAADLHLAATKLVRLRGAVEELRSRLVEKEREIRKLQTRVEVYLHVADKVNAWRHALELDRLRKTIDQERSQLRRRQHAYDVQRAFVRHLREQLDKYPSEM